MEPEKQYFFELIVCLSDKIQRLQIKLNRSQLFKSEQILLQQTPFLTSFTKSLQFRVFSTSNLGQLVKLFQLKLTHFGIKFFFSNFVAVLQLSTIF